MSEVEDSQPERDTEEEVMFKEDDPHVEKSNDFIITLQWFYITYYVCFGYSLNMGISTP